MCVCLTQPLAVLRGRRRQTGDPTSVTPQVLVLRCRGNMPYLHCRIPAKWRKAEKERMQEEKKEVIVDEGRRTKRRQSQKAFDVNLWRLASSDRGGGRKTNACQTLREESGSILSDKSGEMPTLHIHYANQDFFPALPSRNHHAVNSNHTGDDVIVTLQPPQAKLCLLPRQFEGCKFGFCERNDLRN